MQQVRATNTIVLLKVGGAFAALGGFVGCGVSVMEHGPATGVYAFVCIAGFVAFVVGRFMQ